MVLKSTFADAASLLERLEDRRICPRSDLILLIRFLSFATSTEGPFPRSCAIWRKNSSGESPAQQHDDQVVGFLLIWTIHQLSWVRSEFAAQKQEKRQILALGVRWKNYQESFCLNHGYMGSSRWILELIKLSKIVNFWLFFYQYSSKRCFQVFSRAAHSVQFLQISNSVSDLQASSFGKS